MSTSKPRLERAQTLVLEPNLSHPSQKIIQQMTDPSPLSHKIISQIREPSHILAFICLLNLLLVVMLIVQLIKMLILLITLIVLIRLLSLVFGSFHADGK